MTDEQVIAKADKWLDGAQAKFATDSFVVNLVRDLRAALTACQEERDRLKQYPCPECGEPIILPHLRCQSCVGRPAQGADRPGERRQEEAGGRGKVVDCPFCRSGYCYTHGRVGEIGL